MTPEAQLAAITPIIHKLLEVEGCPPLPDGIFWSVCDQRYYLIARTFDNKEVILPADSPIISAINDWVMGAVVPWAAARGIYVRYGIHETQSGELVYSWACHTCNRGKDRGYSLSTLALLRAICGVVCGGSE